MSANSLDKNWGRVVMVAWVVGLSAGIMLGIVASHRGLWGPRYVDRVEKKVGIGRYLYVQKVGEYSERVVHIDRECGAILRSKPIDRRRTDSLLMALKEEGWLLHFVCPLCANDSVYDKMVMGVELAETEED